MIYLCQWIFILAMVSQPALSIELEGTQGGRVREFLIPLEYEIVTNDSTKPEVFFQTEHFRESWKLIVSDQGQAELVSSRARVKVSTYKNRQKEPMNILIGAKAVADLVGIDVEYEGKSSADNFVLLPLKQSELGSQVTIQPNDQKIFTVSFAITP